MNILYSQLLCVARSDVALCFAIEKLSRSACGAPVADRFGSAAIALAEIDSIHTTRARRS